MLMSGSGTIAKERASATDANSGESDNVSVSRSQSVSLFVCTALCLAPVHPLMMTTLGRMDTNGAHRWWLNPVLKCVGSERGIWNASPCVCIYLPAWSFLIDTSSHLHFFTIDTITTSEMDHLWAVVSVFLFTLLVFEIGESGDLQQMIENACTFSNRRRKKGNVGNFSHTPAKIAICSLCK